MQRLSVNEFSNIRIDDSVICAKLQQTAMTIRTAFQSTNSHIIFDMSHQHTPLAVSVMVRRLQQLVPFLSVIVSIVLIFPALLPLEVLEKRTDVH